MGARHRLSARAGSALALLLLFPIFFSACARTGGDPPRRVLLILLDAARADRFGAYGYPRDTTPNMDRLARRGLVFTRHFTQSTDTRGSLPSLFYSRYFIKPLFPHSPDVPFSSPEDLFQRVDDEAFSIPRAFAEAGFATAAISAHIWIKPQTELAREFQEMNDLSLTAGYDPEFGYPRGEAVVDAAIEWLEAHRESDAFLYLHFMDTHFPHFLGPEARDFLGDDPYDARPFHRHGAPKDPSRPLAAPERAYLDAIYDGSLRYCDEQIGRLLAHLAAEGALESSLVAIVTDHGEHLLEVPGRVMHGGPWYDAVARGPLILFHPPRVGPGRVDALSENVDVSPTLLRLMDVPIPAGKRADGVDLMEVVAGNAAAGEHALMSRGIRGTRYKALFSERLDELLGEEPPAVDAMAGELFDLAADPEERSNLWQRQPEIAGRLFTTYRERLRDRFRRFRAAVGGDQPDSAFAIKATYLESGSEIPAAPLGTAPSVLAGIESATGWLRVTHWETPWLIARPGAAAIEFELALPNGEYLVSAHLRGRGSVLPGGAERPVELVAPPFGLSSLAAPEPADVGPVTVTDERFRATLEPAGESWLGIRFLAFTPVKQGEPVAEPDEETLERLRTLGYVD